HTAEKHCRTCRTNIEAKHSKSLVNRLPGSAHGTEATTTPHLGQSTRGMAATSSTRQQPEVLATPAAHSAALVIPAVPPSAAGASERARTRAHADLEHGLGTQRRVDDPHVLDHRAFDVEKLVEYAAHQALFGCAFLGR
ncbi:hypothetical protein, partial [Bifidobacterium longum]